MDLSTMIVDLLRGSKEEEILNRGGPIAKAAPRPEPDAAAEALTSPAYFQYKREALANGEPVLSPEEFKRAQAEGRF